uniref:Uncharacterized protein n=1 Tax=Cucumis melo TaxID=3656 RepID=A0A9I9EBY4_CUCME
MVGQRILDFILKTWAQSDSSITSLLLEGRATTNLRLQTTFSSKIRPAFFSMPPERWKLESDLFCQEREKAYNRDL